MELLAAGGEETDELVLAELVGGVDRERVARRERHRRLRAGEPAVLAGEPVGVGRSGAPAVSTRGASQRPLRNSG